LIPKWIRCVEAGLDQGDIGAARLFAEYMWGKPIQKMDVTSNNEPLRLITVNVKRNLVDQAIPITSHIEVPDDTNLLDN
jgi:hypothetical protein